MVFKVFFPTVLVASVAFATPARVPLPVPESVTHSCRVPAQSDYPSARVHIRNHSEFTQQHYPERINQFMRSPLNCGDIVMLGDSLTERFNWQQAISASRPVRNRGIAGDTSDGVLARLGELTAVRPKAVFVMIGTNDLWTSNSPSRVAANVAQIITTLRAGDPDVQIYIQTLFPVRSEPALNTRVRQINTRLADLAGSQNVHLIDTFSLLVDNDGLLGARYTEDGVHLTSVGYSRWVDLVRSIAP